MTWKEMVLVALVALFFAVMPTCKWESDVTQEMEEDWYEYTK